MDAQFYLKKLIIQNFATFKNQNINFRPGFNAIVGETGSGKSLVLDALELILGGRADKKVVRRDTEYSLIEASFHCSDKNIQSYLEQEGFPTEGSELVIKRLIYRNGSTKTYINHLSTTMTFLSQFAKRYIDIVGQFENQKLLSENYQLHLLDYFSKNFELVSEYQSLLRQYKQDITKKNELINSKALREQRLDYLNYQLLEIEKLNPSSQEEEELLKKKFALVNMEKTQKLCLQAKDILEGNDGHQGVLSQMKFLSSLLVKNPEIFQPMVEKSTELFEGLAELDSFIDKKLNTDADPDELENLVDRLDLYQKLKKKFGGSVESIIQSKTDFLNEKSQLEELDFDLEDLDSRLAREKNSLNLLAKELHQRRVKNANKLASELTKRVRALKMNGATIKVEVAAVDEFLETGMSRAYFIAETNLGEGFFKIKDIASGGELSRILLSVRQILSSFDSISIFLFDEIDTGIGGETANCIGKALQEVAAHGQVIAITHLPQIAQFAEALMVVQKDVQEEDKAIRTESSVREIIGKMILKEVKAMAQLT